MTCLKVCTSSSCSHPGKSPADPNHLGAFYMVGDIESARAKGEKIMAELEKS